MIKPSMNLSGSDPLPVPTTLWRLVANALENERALDVEYRERYTTLPPGGPVPNFKVMKQLALQRQLGCIYPFIIALAPIAILLLAPWHWLLLLTGAACGQRLAPEDGACRIIATTKSNRAIIDAALDSDRRVATLPRHEICFDPRGVGAEIGWSACASVVLAHLRWIHFALTRPAVERRDLLLHGYDVVALLGLVSLARQTSGVYVTDDHYQRWAYVLSYAAKDCRIVQHGFLDEELVLPHPGGRVACLYLRDFLFQASFERYYLIIEYRQFSPAAAFVWTPLSSNALLLASSFPSIDEEIRLLTVVRSNCRELPIIVKFHPAHLYDSRRDQLAALATFVYEEAGNPTCRVFASYGSFMEFDYRAQGIATVSISRSSGIEAAAEEIRILSLPL